jgi:hypothetical protein
MVKSFYLVVSRTRVVRTTKRAPSLGWGEIGIRVKLELPDSLFVTPALQAHIVIPESAVKTKVLDTEVIANVKNAIEESTGLDIRLILEEPKELEG